MDQLNKRSIIPPHLVRPRIGGSFRLALNDETSDVEIESLPSWFTKSSDDFDVLISQRNLIDADYLYSVREHIQSLADETNAALKRNVFKNYFIFIETSKEILNIKLELRQLNALLDKQQTSIIRIMDQLNKRSIIPPHLVRPRIGGSFRLALNDETSDVEAELLPSWFTKSPEDFDVLIAQRNLKEAVELAHKVRNHLDQYPKCCENSHSDLKTKIDLRLQELVNAICSELQPSTDRSVQGGPRSSVSSIQLLRELDLSAKAVKLYLDQRSSRLKFVLKQQTKESTTSFKDIKQMCSIFFNTIVETWKEFKQAFEIDVMEHPLVVKQNSPNTFRNLATYASFVYWATQEFENFIIFFRERVFDNPQLSTAMVAESVHHFNLQCSKNTIYCGIDMSKFIQRQLEDKINQVILDCEKRLVDTVKRLNSEEQWQPQQFQNTAQMTRFFDEMNDVNLKTMPSYIYDDHKLRFTACKTSFARYFLLTLNELAKLVNSRNEDLVDSVLAKTFELQMEAIVDALRKTKISSRIRFIMGNSNFLLDKVIKVAASRYLEITGLRCHKLIEIGVRYRDLVNMDVVKGKCKIKEG